MGGGGNEMTVLEWRAKQLARYEAGRVRNVGHNEGAYFIGYGADAGIIPIAAVGGGATDDELGLVLQRLAFHHIVVNEAGVFVDAVVDRVVKLAGKIDRRAVGKVATHAKIEPEDGIAGVKDGEHEGGIGLGTAVWLHIGIGYAEHFLSAIDGELFAFVDHFAAAVIAAAGVAFGIFIGHHTAHGTHYLHAGEVLGGDEFQAVALAFEFFVDEFCYQCVWTHIVYWLEFGANILCVAEVLRAKPADNFPIFFSGKVGSGGG